MSRFARYVVAGMIVGLVSLQAGAQAKVSVEGGLTWQTRNDQRIPGNAGTQFSIADFNRGPFATYRAYVGYSWNKQHELRALYAPLRIETVGRFASSTRFMDVSYSANRDTRAIYKFNSYRLTYAYHFEVVQGWDFAVGFTGKIRDAEVRLVQGSMDQRKTNIGFVPLLNLQARRELASGLAFRFDFDGLAAPQGRAFDAAAFIETELPWDGYSLFAGYRTVEGGADNDEVYNFAWIHTAVMGVTGKF